MGTEVRNPTVGYQLEDAAGVREEFVTFQQELPSTGRRSLLRQRAATDAAALERAKAGVRIVNVARGPLIDNAALVTALGSGRVHSAALEVVEQEPLDPASALRSFERCIFGSHNASNSEEAVRATSVKAIGLLRGFLENGRSSSP